MIGSVDLIFISEQNLFGIYLPISIVRNDFN